MTNPDPISVLREAANELRGLSSFVTPEAITSAWAKFDTALAALGAEQDGLKEWTPERLADLESLVLEALERDFDLGRAITIKTMAKHVVERLMLEPKVWEFPALGETDHDG